MKITITHEKELLGTAGTLKQNITFFQKRFRNFDSC